MPTDVPNSSAPPADPAAEWRSRAEASEDRLRDLEARLVETARQLSDARAALDATERKRQIEREVMQADAIDLESATLLTEAAVAAMSTPDVALAVKDLRKRKPFLFRAGAPHAASASSAAGPAGHGRVSAMAGVPRNPPDDLARVADEAGPTACATRRTTRSRSGCASCCATWRTPSSTAPRPGARPRARRRSAAR